MYFMSILRFLQNPREYQISFLMTPNLWKLDSDFWRYKKKLIIFYIFYKLFYSISPNKPNRQTISFVVMRHIWIHGLMLHSFLSVSLDRNLCSALASIPTAFLLPMANIHHWQHKNQSSDIRDWDWPPRHLSIYHSPVWVQRLVLGFCPTAHWRLSFEPSLVFVSIPDPNCPTWCHRKKEKVMI